MNGKLIREVYHDRYILGHLDLFDGFLKVFSCKTLERPWKDNARDVSCVPAGEYPVVREYSPHFDQDLNELKLVPGRNECKIHVANYVMQLEGCIGVGLSIGDINHDGLPDMVSSRKALDRLQAALGDAMQWQLEIIGNGTDLLQEGMNGWP
jgi:hypothetical protein